MELINKDTITLEIAEKENVANILLSNFASQALNLGAATEPNDVKEHTVGLEIAYKQAVSFVANLIAENGNLKLETLDKS